MTGLHSCIYTGWVRHRRTLPVDNSFTYNVFMMYVDLDELEGVLSISRWWSGRWFSPARFKRGDFHGDSALPLGDAIKRTVYEHTGSMPEGPIRMLANWRYFGYNMNPLCTYYCFDKTGENLQYILAEVNNTPWNQSHPYVLQCDAAHTKQFFVFDKAFHVSPFNQLTMTYRWCSTTPAKSLLIHIENWQMRHPEGESQRIMDATLTLEREELSAATLRRVLIRYPLMTVKVVAAIYWQALKLWSKKIPFVDHPNNVPRQQLIIARSKGKL